MAEDYPTSPNPWVDSSPKYASLPSSLERIISSARDKKLLPPDFDQRAEESFKQSHTCKFIAVSEKTDQLLNELYKLKLDYQRLQYQKELSKLFTREKLDNSISSLDGVTKLFSSIVQQKDVISSILSIDANDCDLSIPPSTHDSLEGLLVGIQKSVSIVNSLESDLTALKDLSTEGKVLTDLEELRTYIDSCVDAYRDTYTKIKNLTELY